MSENSCVSILKVALGETWGTVGLGHHQRRFAVIENIDFRRNMTDKSCKLQALAIGVRQRDPVNVIDEEVLRAAVRQTFAIKAD